jgi:hypothetical protein
MATTKKNATQTPAPAKTAEQVAADKARNILMQADLYRRNYEKAREEFLARANDNPADAIAWRGEGMTIATVQYAQVAHYGLLLPDADMASIFSDHLILSITPAEVIERATKMVRYLTRQLLGRSVGRGSSTGHFHNAVDGATAEAYSRTVRDLAHYCTAMDVDELVYA